MNSEQLHKTNLLSPDSIDGNNVHGSLSMLNRTGVAAQTSRCNSIDSCMVPNGSNGHIVIRRTASNDNELDTSESQVPLTHSDGMVQLREKSHIRRLVGKRNSFGQFFRRRPLPTLDTEEKQQWTDCFSVDGCAVASYQSMTTSAVAHMRRLAIEPIKRENRPSIPTSDEGSPETPRRMTFEATPIKSLTIESDDSELDDYD